MTKQAQLQTARFCKEESRATKKRKPPVRILQKQTPPSLCGDFCAAALANAEEDYSNERLKGDEELCQLWSAWRRRSRSESVYTRPRFRGPCFLGSSTTRKVKLWLNLRSATMEAFLRKRPQEAGNTFRTYPTDINSLSIKPDRRASSEPKDIPLQLACFFNLFSQEQTQKESCPPKPTQFKPPQLGSKPIRATPAGLCGLPFFSRRRQPKSNLVLRG